jgi:Lipocalin-like domain
VFGTYTVDENKKPVTYTIVSASFPNWEGEAQNRAIDKFTADEPVGATARAIFTGRRSNL